MASDKLSCMTKLCAKPPSTCSARSPWRVAPSVARGTPGERRRRSSSDESRSSALQFKASAVQFYLSRTARRQAHRVPKVDGLGRRTLRKEAAAASSGALPPGRAGVPCAAWHSWTDACALQRQDELNRGHRAQALVTAVQRAIRHWESGVVLRAPPWIRGGVARKRRGGHSTNCARP